MLYVLLALVQVTSLLPLAASQIDISNSTSMLRSNDIITLSDDFQANSTRRRLSQGSDEHLASEVWSFPTSDGDQRLNLSIAISACTGLRRSIQIGHYNDSRGLMHTDATIGTIEDDMRYMQRLGGSEADQQGRYLAHARSTIQEVITLAEGILDDSVERIGVDTAQQVFHTELRKLLYDHHDVLKVMIGSFITASGALQAFISLRHFDMLPATDTALNTTASSLAATLEDIMPASTTLILVRNIILKLGLASTYLYLALRLQEYYAALGDGPAFTPASIVSICASVAAAQLFILQLDVSTFLAAWRARRTSNVESLISQQDLLDAAKAVEVTEFTVSSGDGEARYVPFSKAEGLVQSDQCPL